MENQKGKSSKKDEKELLDAIRKKNERLKKELEKIKKELLSRYRKNH